VSCFLDGKQPSTVKNWCQCAIVIFVEQAQPKNELVTPPPDTDAKIYTNARYAGDVTFFTILQYVWVCAILHFLHFYNFITLKLGSTTKQMPEGHS
jgi:hypothetical protein